MGDSLENAYLLVERSSFEDFADDEGLTWFLVRLQGSSSHVLAQGTRRVQGLYLSPSQSIYLIGTREGRFGLHIGKPQKETYVWEERAIEKTDIQPPSLTRLNGIWGVSDELIFIWGEEVNVSIDGGSVKSKVAPSIWSLSEIGWEKHILPERIRLLHGVDARSVYALGETGRLFQWNGAGWNDTGSAPVPNLAFLRVHQARDVYAATMNGCIWRNTGSAWYEISREVGFVYSLLSWAKHIWLPTQYGLHRVTADKIELLYPRIIPCLITGGKHLLWTTYTEIQSTANFSSFQTRSLEEIFQTL